MQLLLFALLFFHLQLFAIEPDSAGPKRVQQPLAIKDCMLTAESLISSGKISNSKWLTQKQVEELSISKIDDAYNADNLYHVFDTLYASTEGKVILLGREHEDENKAWLVSYLGNQLVDSAVIYYDNSEGFLLTETIIKSGIITIVTLNDYEVDAARKKVVHYKMNKHLHLEKLPVQKNIDSVKIDN